MACAKAPAPNVVPTTFRATRRLTLVMGGLRGVRGLGQEAIARRVPPPIRGLVRVVAIDAMIAAPLPPREVPVPAHAAVGSTPVVAGLGAVALRAELERLAPGQHLSTGEAQLVRPLIVVTGAAVELAVTNRQASVELTQLSGRVGQRGGAPLRVAADAGDSTGSPQSIELPARHAAESGAVDDHPPAGQAGSGSELLHARSVGSVARRGAT